MTDSRKYYVGGKCYEPAASAHLCTAYLPLDGEHKDDFELTLGEPTKREDLYRTESGVFYIVREEEYGGPTVEIVNEKKALAFMDAHPGNIDTDAYDAIFGAPERA